MAARIVKLLNNDKISLDRINGKHCVLLQRAMPNPGLNDMKQPMSMNIGIRIIKQDEEA
jgi:hypothetical protein